MLTHSLQKEHPNYPNQLLQHILRNTHTEACRTNWENQSRAEHTSAVRILANTLNSRTSHWAEKTECTRNAFTPFWDKGLQSFISNRPAIYVLVTQTTWRLGYFNSLHSNSEKHLTMYLTLSAHPCQFLFTKNHTYT